MPPGEETKERESETNIENLLTEMLEHVGSYLRFKEICCLSTTTKKLRKFMVTSVRQNTKRTHTWRDLIRTNKVLRLGKRKLSHGPMPLRDLRYK